MNNSNLSLPNVIDGVTGSHNIVNMWKSHYEDLFNCLSNNKDVNNISKNAEFQRDVEMSHSEIIHAITDFQDNIAVILNILFMAPRMVYCSII